jgi:uncharacterized RDD family membrane protein YckC
MAEREPALLGERPEARREPAGEAVERPSSLPRRPQVQGPTVHVAGFWRRSAAAVIDLAVVVPVAALMCWAVSAAADVRLPPSKTRSLDFWLDLVIASDPALVTGAVVSLLVLSLYLLAFHVLLGRTLGMRLLGLRVIDPWGDAPSIARCVARTGGYLLGVATMALGFLWVGFDSERRGLHDWLSGTYVIKA